MDVTLNLGETALLAKEDRKPFFAFKAEEAKESCVKCSQLLDETPSRKNGTLFSTKLIKIYTPHRHLLSL